MCQQRKNSSSTMKNFGNMVSQKESDNSPKTKLKVTEHCNLTDREFKIVVIKKQTNSETEEL